MSLPLPTKCRFNNFSIAGADLTYHLKQIKLYQSLHKPYMTAKATIIDNNNIIENLGLVGGEPMNFSFDVGDGKGMGISLNLLKIHGKESSQNLRTIIYDADFIGQLYFADKGGLVQQSFKQISATDAIAIISNTYLGGKGLQILASSLGPISLQSYIVGAQKPLTAIKDLARRATYGQYKTGNTLFFENNDGLVLGPLEALFDRLAPMNSFIQEATWGKDWFDIVRAQNAIIACMADIEGNENASRGSVKDIAGVAQQEKKVFDFRTKKVEVEIAAAIPEIGKVIGQAAGLAAGIIGGIGGRHGSVPNYMTMDSSHLPKETDPQNKAEAERLYGALTKNGPMMLVKVPIQSGIDLTVGKGAELKLIPPVGDQGPIGSDQSGLYLVTELCHDLSSDAKMVNATTTFQCARGGIG